jgi:hypothetical protein
VAGSGWPVPRPVSVRVAVGLGLLLAAYNLVYALQLFAGVSISAGYWFAGAAFLAVSGLATAGSVYALIGRGSTVLVAAGAAFVALTAVGLALALLNGVDIGLWPLVLIALGVAVVVLPNLPDSRAFFAAARDRR